jgi:hypothetical protein
MAGKDPFGMIKNLDKSQKQKQADKINKQIGDYYKSKKNS